MSATLHVKIDSRAVMSLLNSSSVSVLTALGEGIRNNARSKAPVRTGRLRDSIGYYVVGGNPPTLYVQATAPYARFVNNGTRWMRAQPFLSDALREARL